MPGVYRPYTAADIIGSLQDGIDNLASNATSTTSGLGFFAEDDETITISDPATGTVLNGGSDATSTGSATGTAVSTGYAPTPAVWKAEAHAGDGTGTLTSIAVNLPAGTVVGDLLVAVLDGGNGLTQVNAPAGWTLFIPLWSDNIDSAGAAWWKIATASEPSTYTFTWAPASRICVSIQRISGANPGNPIRSWHRNQATGTGASFTSTVLPGTQLGDLIVACGIDGDDNGVVGATITPPGAPWTTANNFAGGWKYQANSYLAGPQGSTTATFQSSSSSAWWNIITYAVEPAQVLPGGALYAAIFADQSTLNPETITLTAPGFVSQGVNTNGSGAVNAGAVADMIAPAGGATPAQCTWTLGDSVLWVAALAVYPAASPDLPISRGNSGGLQSAGFTSSFAYTWPVGSQPVAGQKVILYVTCHSTAATVADNGIIPATWVRDVIESGIAGATDVAVWHADDITMPAAGQFTVTVTIPGGNSIFAVGIAYTGVAAGSPAWNTGQWGSVAWQEQEEPVQLQLVATTGKAGFALQNATPNILSWTAPNDGQMHTVLVPSELVITSAQTGGAVGVSFTDPSNTLRNRTQYAGGLAAGDAFDSPMYLVYPGTTVILEQTSAQTAGAATIYAQIWAA